MWLGTEWEEEGGGGGEEGVPIERLGGASR